MRRRRLLNAGKRARRHDTIELHILRSREPHTYRTGIPHEDDGEEGGGLQEGRCKKKGIRVEAKKGKRAGKAKTRKAAKASRRAGR